MIMIGARANAVTKRIGGHWPVPLRVIIVSFLLDTISVSVCGQRLIRCLCRRDI